MSLVDRERNKCKEAGADGGRDAWAQMSETDKEKCKARGRSSTLPEIAKRIERLQTQKRKVVSAQKKQEPVQPGDTAESASAQVSKSPTGGSALSKEQLELIAARRQEALERREKRMKLASAGLSDEVRAAGC